MENMDDLKDRIQRDIDEIAQFGYCNYSKTFQTLIDAKQRIGKLEQELIHVKKTELTIHEKITSKEKR